jgi:carotenoid phi-ring synthase / carotenoid chi-ring synthase
VIIIGAGLAGLTAALHLAERGISPLVLEADPNYAGGRLGGGPPVTIQQQGQAWSFPGEHGIHGVWGQYHNLRDMLDRHNIDPGFIKARKEAWILRQPSGKMQWSEGGSALRTSWIPAPFHYLALFIRPRFLQMLTLRDLASMFRLLASLLLAIAFDPAVEGTRLEGLTLADFFKGWSPTLQALFVGLARNFTSERPEHVPQAGFIAFLRFYTLLRRDAWAFSYFDRDSDLALIAPLRKRLDAAGGSLRLGIKVTALCRDGDRWRVEWDGGSAYAEHVILALDGPACRKLLLDSPSTAEAAKTLDWPLAVPTAVLRFWFSRTPRGASARPEAGIFTGDFVLDNYFWLHRIQQTFREWHETTGGSAIECHVYGPPQVLAEPDAVLLAKGLLDLQKVWPALRGSVITQSIRRNPATHTLFSVGEAGQHLGTETPWSDLWACGDWLRYPHGSLYMERATVTGIAAANAVLRMFRLEEWPIQPVDRPELLARGFERLLRWIRRGARAYNRRKISRQHPSP